jgi:ankyrin repeat protein
VRLLLQARAVADAADSNGMTALLAAISSTANSANALAVVDLLLAAGANRRLRNRDKASAAEITASRGFNKIVALLGG